MNTIRTSKIIDLLLGSPYANIPSIYMELGTKRHTIMESAIKNNADAFLDYIKSEGIKFTDKKIIIEYSIKKQFDNWLITGHVDMLIGNNTLIEFKSSQSSLKHALIQTNIYQQLLNKSNMFKYMITLKDAVNLCNGNVNLQKIRITPLRNLTNDELNLKEILKKYEYTQKNNRNNKPTN